MIDDGYPFPGPDPDGEPAAEDSGVLEEYDHDCRIVRKQRESEPDLYHYENPLGRMQTFENPHKARLYADVATVVSGFREEKTGERGRCDFSHFSNYCKAVDLHLALLYRFRFSVFCCRAVGIQSAVEIREERLQRAIRLCERTAPKILR